jgi:hypothetical protein
MPIDAGFRMASSQQTQAENASNRERTVERLARSFAGCHRAVSSVGSQFPNGPSTMWSYFRGWKHKLGVVMLLMACVSVGAWIRSLTDLDALIRLNAHDTHVVLSAEGTFNWERMSPIVTPRASRWMYRHDSSNINEGFDVPMGFLGLGFDFRTQSDLVTTAGTAPYILESETWQIPYWSIVIPLTLISAWCLLTKPRTKPATKPEPADESGSSEVVPCLSQ